VTYIVNDRDGKRERKKKRKSHALNALAVNAKRKEGKKKERKQGRKEGRMEGKREEKHSLRARKPDIVKLANGDCQ